MRVDRCDSCGVERPQRFVDHDGYYAWVHVEANEDADHGDFCSWSCLAAWATTRAVDREGKIADEA